MAFWKTEDESLEELQEQNEKMQVKAKNTELQLSIAQKNMALQKLKEAGLSPSSFDNSWKKIMGWVKGH
jgi:hypothetical protein